VTSITATGTGGLVTDGSVRDTDELIGYGFPVFSHSTTAKQGPAVHQPWECNGVLECGGVVVRPGDAIVGDQDGVVVVPAAAAQQVHGTLSCFWGGGVCLKSCYRIPHLLA
jgi:regulator of RNase E activity RraA